VIFVTVGTHEQPFDRLLAEVDRLAGEGRIGDVFCQTGYSTYRPEHARWTPMIAFAEMQDLLTSASVVISHGGPGTLAPVLASGRPLVLVPRQHKFGEHVDDHQVAFCRRISAERGLPLVLDIEELEAAIDEAAQQKAAAVGDHRSADAAVLDLRRRIEDLLER
jgi:UDP-N-acetylglucosamine transferase subunit ALG13